MTRVVIVHQEALFRQCVSIALAQRNIEVVGLFANAHGAVRKIAQLCPDVVLLDPPSIDQAALDGTRAMRQASPQSKVLIMGVTEREPEILACIHAGAAGYLHDEATLEDLLNNIHAVVAGEALFSPRIAGFLLSHVADTARQLARVQPLGAPHLSRREIDITTLIEEGLSNKEIAVRLGIEVQTVKNHVHNILEKLQLDGRREAARYAREQGWLRLSRE